jgi:hypothetical protein
MPHVTDLVTNPFQDKPAYRYIRKADRLPLIIGRDVPDEKVLCKVKLFNPTGSETWWIASYDPVEQIAWGAAQAPHLEVGTIYMPELVAIRGQFGLPIERDIYWRPKNLRVILDGYGG